MESVRCTRCGKSTVVEGFAASGQENYASNPGVFVPRQTKLFRSTPGVKFAGAILACVSCGHAWADIDPDALREYIATQGTELARQQMNEFVHGPTYGMPDTTHTREIAGKVAEIDALVRAGKPPARRYRELRGVKWDQAINETREWHNLKREEKLALFGWEPKAKGPLDEFF